MELDILNEIFTSTVSDLFQAPYKYNLLAPIQRQQAGLGGVKSLVQKQQQQQQNQKVGPPVSTQNQQVQIQNPKQQPIQQPIQVIKPNVQEKSNCADQKKSASSSLNSSLTSNLLDQTSNSQLNYSKDIINTRGTSLNSSFQNNKLNDIVPQQVGMVKDFMNVIPQNNQYNASTQILQPQILPQVYQQQQQQYQPAAQQYQPQQYQNSISFSQNTLPSQLGNSNNQMMGQYNLQHQQQQILQQQPLQQQNVNFYQFQQSQQQQQQTIQQVPKQFLNNFINESNPQQKQIITKPISQEEWIQIEAPKRLEESLKKLNLDTTKISMRLIKEMGLEQLQTEKKRVKNEVKQYDEGFERQFGIPPTRNQKEPMRPLYIYYQGLKQAISKFGSNNENINPSGTNKIKTQQTNLNVQNKISQEVNSIQSSLTTGIISHQNSQNDSFDVNAGKYQRQSLQQGFQVLQPQQTNQQQQQTSQQQYSRGNSQQPKGGEIRKGVGELKPINQGKGLSDDQTGGVQQLNQAPSQAQTIFIEQKIQVKKRKRAILREQLQAYQDDFQRTHNRKIKYHKDILPVEQEYKEYKDIKKEIFKLEQILQPSLNGNNNNNNINNNEFGFQL